MSNRMMTAVLFTDLVESTALASRLGPDRTNDLRRTHFGVLREAILESGGTEVKNLGDGLMVVFDGPSQSLACATAMQRAVARHNRRASEALLVRVGLSVGEVVHEDGDYFGEPVVEAARLCAAASGGQILTTDLVRAIAGRHTPHLFRVVGDLELKGIPEPVGAVEVQWESDDGDARIPMPPRLVAATRHALFGFIGRVEMRARLDDARKAAFSEPQLQTVFVAGEAGIGKTSLVAETAAIARAEGANVVFGHCDEDLVVPYQPWIEVLSHLVEHLGADCLDPLSPAHRRALSRLIPALGTDRTSSGGIADSERLVMIQAVEALLTEASSWSPIVLVLDDLHWADAASLQVLRHLVTAGAEAAILIVGTYRQTDLGHGHSLGALLADLRRWSGVTWIKLEGLDDAETVALVASSAGHDLDDVGVDLAHAIRRETQGNPFFTVELLRHLGESDIVHQGADGRWQIDGDLSAIPLPASIREVVGRRVARLGTDGSQILSIASVIGRDFAFELLAGIGDWDEDQMLDLLDAAVAAAVIAEVDGSPGVYRFGHALIQRTLYEDLSDARRARIHHRVAEALERLPAGGYAAEIARHWVEAVAPADLDRALRAVVRAADEALASLAPHDAIRWYEKALELAAHAMAGDQRLRCQLLVGLGTAQHQVGSADHRETLLEAVGVARAIDDTDLLVSGVLAADRGIAGTSSTDIEWVQATEEALEAVGPADSRARARLLTVLSQVIDAHEWERRRDLIGEAVAVARRIDDDASLLFILPVAYQHHGPEGLDRRLAETAEAIELATRLGDPLASCNALFHRIDACLQAADIEEVDRRIAELATRAESIDLPLHLWQLHMVVSLRALLDGRCDDAETEADMAREVGLGGGHAEALLAYGAQLVDIRRQQGRLDEVLTLLPEAGSEQAMSPGTRHVVGAVYAEVGLLDDAAMALEHDKETGFKNIPVDEAWLAMMSCCTAMATAVEDRGASRLLYDLLLPYERRIIAAYATCGGAVDRLLGRLAATLGRYPEAERHFLAALELHEQLRAPYWVAATQLDLRDLLAARAEPGDEARARELAEAARQAASAHGYRGLASRAVGP